MKKKENMTDVKFISSLPAFIDKPGYYKLCRKLHYDRKNHSENAITIASDDVTLDGNNAKIKVKENGTAVAPIIGLLIQAPAGTFITNVKVFNLYITASNPSTSAGSNFVYGVLVDSAHHVVLESLVLTNLTFGVILTNTLDVTINKTLFGNITGIPITTPFVQESAAIDLDSNTQSTFIRNCTFNNPSNSVAPLQSRGITSNQSIVTPSIGNTNVIVEDSTFEYFTTTAILDIVSDVRFSRISSTQVNTRASAIQLSYNTTRDFIIEDSIFTSTGNGPVGYDGLLISGQNGLIQNVVLNTDSESATNADAALHFAGAQNVVARNVTIAGTNSVGVLIDAHTTPSHNITLDNIQVNNASTDVLINAAANVVLKNSEIFNNPTTTNVGVKLVNTSGVVIRNNNFSNNPGGGVVVDSTTKGIVDGNEFVNSPPPVSNLPIFLVTPNNFSV